MTGRRAWTARERDRLLARTPGETLEDLARALGRSYRAVCAAVRRFGVPRKKGWRVLAGREAAYRRLHAEGYCDREAALKMGVSQATVRSLRGRLGLAANMHLRSARYLAERRRNYRRCLSEHLGCADFGEFHRRRGELEAARRGWWPHATGAVQCDVLDALLGGPLTTRQLCVKLGRPYSPKDGGATVTTHARKLAARGVIVSRRHGMGKLHGLAGGVTRRTPDEKATFVNLPRRDESPLRTLEDS